MRYSDDLTTGLKAFEKSLKANFNCVKIGKVSSVDFSVQTLEMEITMKATKGEKVIDYPLLVDVPFMVLQGGGSYIEMPISAGDFAILLFNDRDIDTWWASGVTKQPNTTRLHSLSDALAIVGINNKISPIGLNGDKLRIVSPEIEIKSKSGLPMPAAREGDEIEISGETDFQFYLWLGQVAAVINGMAPGSVTPATPPKIRGKIFKGSNEVKIS